MIVDRNGGGGGRKTKQALRRRRKSTQKRWQRRRPSPGFDTQRSMLPSAIVGENREHFMQRGNATVHNFTLCRIVSLPGATSNRLAFAGDAHETSFQPQVLRPTEFTMANPLASDGAIQRTSSLRGIMWSAFFITIAHRAQSIRHAL